MLDMNSSTALESYTSGRSMLRITGLSEDRRLRIPFRLETEHLGEFRSAVFHWSNKA